MSGCNSGCAGVALQPEDILSKAYTSLADHVTALEGKEGHSNPSRPDASSISDMPIDHANGEAQQQRLVFVGVYERHSRCLPALCTCSLYAVAPSHSEVPFLH